MTFITNKKKSVIYEPSGAAAEYCRRALNLFDGCVHGCKYCYVPLVRYTDRPTFHATARPRLSLEDIEASARATRGDTRPILLCFSCDPYQNTGLVNASIMRATIQLLHKYGHPVAVLTKAGGLAQRDFGLYRPGDSFGVSLTHLDKEKSRQWEPGAADPEIRIGNLIEAKMAGIDTWVSLEPVIDPQESLAIITATAGFVDHYKTGPLNYYKGELPVPVYDWKKYVQDFIYLAAIKYKRGVYVKKAFSSCYGSPNGYRVGDQVPREV